MHRPKRSEEAQRPVDVGIAPTGAKIRSRERVRVRKQKKHIIDVLFKKKSVRRGAKGPEDLC